MVHTDVSPSEEREEVADQTDEAKERDRLKREKRSGLRDGSKRRRGEGKMDLHGEEEILNKESLEEDVELVVGDDDEELSKALDRVGRDLKFLSLELPTYNVINTQ